MSLVKMKLEPSENKQSKISVDNHAMLIVSDGCFNGGYGGHVYFIARSNSTLKFTNVKFYFASNEQKYFIFSFKSSFLVFEKCCFTRMKEYSLVGFESLRTNGDVLFNECSFEENHNMDLLKFKSEFLVTLLLLLFFKLN